MTLTALAKNTIYILFPVQYSLKRPFPLYIGEEVFIICVVQIVHGPESVFSPNSTF